MMLNPGTARSTAATASARAELIDHLRESGIRDERVLHAIAMVPREEFVQDAFRHRAYEDSALPIACGQTISQPYTVAMMTQLLEAEPGMKVLEVGTGSGYQAAVLHTLGLKVFTIERHFELLQNARAVFQKLGYNIASHLGDGTLGWSTFAPYDRIVVTAGAPDIPTSLLRQLAPDGRLVIPIGGRQQQRMQAAIKIGDTSQYDVFDYGEFKFVPLVGRNAWDQESGGQE